MGMPGLYDFYAAVADFLYEEYGFDSEVLEDYSGRGMFGVEVPALVTEAPPIVVGAVVGYLLPTHFRNSDFEGVSRLRVVMPHRSDSMGEDRTVYY